MPTPAQVEGPQWLRQQERERARREPLERRPDVRLEKKPSELASLTALPEHETPCFPITTFALQGERAGEFQWALLSAIRPIDPPRTRLASGDSGYCLGTVGVNMVMARVQNTIIERGFVTTRVVAQAQDLRLGVLTMTLVPGTVRSVRLTPESGPRARTSNAVAVAPGQLLNLRDLEQALENFKRLPSAEAAMEIEPAQSGDAAALTPGQSDLVIRWTQGRPWRVSLSVDDAGTRATGKYQGNAGLVWDHPLGYNDQLALSLNHDLGGSDMEGSQGTRGGTVHYSVPRGPWLLSGLASRSRYHQSVAGADQRYLYSGHSDTVELKLTRLLYRDGVRKFGVNARLWLRDSNNFIDDTEIEVQRRRMRGWEWGLSHREFVGSSTLDVALAYRQGIGGLGALPAPEEVFDEGTSRMRLLTSDVQWSQPWRLGRHHLRYSAQFRGQWNRTRLVPQDRFSIGGRYTVRGFDGETTLTAERGWLVRNDLGWQVHPTVEGYLGVDQGRVSGPSSIFLAGTKLSGVVLGVRGGVGTSHGVWGYDVFLGQPLSQPEGFPDKATTGGVQLSWNY